ncbi:MAG: aminotransferase class IV, partial [Pseudomonadota bacterium]
MTENQSVSLLVNGMAQNIIAADDRGLLYGDGLFETIAFCTSQAPLWELHMQRLRTSCERLFLPMPEPELLAHECLRLVAGLTRAVVRITLTRGSGGQAYIPPENPKLNRILMRRTYPTISDGVSMIRSGIELDGSDVLSGIKHLNRLEQVLIGRECRQLNAGEALVCDRQGYVVEGLSS